MKPLLRLLLGLLAFLASNPLPAATIVWTNTVGGNWNVAANWSPNSVPGAADTAVITNIGTYTITFNLSATVAGLTLGGASGTQTFAISSQTLTLAGPGTVNANGVFALSGGALAGAGDLTINSLFTWTGGTISGTGNVLAIGGLALSGTGAKFLTGRTLVNTGAATWSGGNILVASGGVLSNAVTGTFDCAFDGSVVQNGGSGMAVANAGLFRKTGGTGTTSFGSVALHNSGTVEVQSGTLTLNGGGTSTGTFTVAPGAVLDFGGGTHTLTNSSVAGAFSVSGGTANFNGTLGGTGALSVLAGAANFNGSSGAITLAQLTVSGGTLGGTNMVVVNGPTIWSGGTIGGGGNVLAIGGLALSGAGNKVLTGRTVVNGGAATWSAGPIFFSNGGVLSNAAAGTFDCTFDGAMQYSSGSGLAVANAGLFRKTAGAGTTSINSPIAFNNSGTVEVQSGTLTLNGGGTSTGTFTASPGAVLDFGGTHTLTNSSVAGVFSVSGGTANFNGTLGGTGALTVSGGSANFNGSSGAITLAQLTVSGGTLAGTNLVVVNGPTIWSSGTIGGGGNVLANGGLTISNALNKTLTGRTLVNGAAATWSAGPIFFSNGGVLSNAVTGTFDCTFDGAMQHSSGSGLALANAGLFRKTAGAGTTSINSPIAFNNAGTVEVQSGSLSFQSPYVQTAGLTFLNGGNLTVTQPFQLLGGTLAGTNTVFGSVTNNGVVSPGASPGRLIVTGTFTQTTNGALNIEIAGTSPGATFDQLIVSNAVVLAGALNVTLTNGFYPAPDFIFSNVVQAASRSGTFARFNFPSNVVGLQINYGTTNADIEVVNTLPILPAITGQTVDELTLLSFNVGASDGDAPGQSLSYSLTNSPSGASIDATGLLTWTPTEAQGPLTTNITVVVTDNGTPNLTSTRTFQAVAREINVPPVLTLPPNQSFAEQTAFNATATATDSDIPVNALTFELVSGPAGLTVSTAGAIAWTPGETQGSNSYTVTVRVTDNNPDAINTQQLSKTNSFVLTVNEVNRAPSLTVPSNQVITEENALSVSASATDPDFPANGLTFSLVSPPAGMLINSGSGAITWTPDETLGSNTFTITVVVTDDNPLAVNAVHLSATNSFTVTVNESNRPPELTVPGSQTITEETTLNVSASATDPDAPANPLTYALVSPPAGMLINPGSGAITWTPTEAQGSNSYTITVTVADTNATAINQKQFIVTNTFLVTVNESNRPPVITPFANTNIDELLPFTATVAATDPDQPANALTFARVSGPVGLTVSPAGVINWTPGENQGPSTNTVVISVTDANPLAVNATSLSVTSSFEIVVMEVNAAPVLGTLINRTVNPGQTISFTATATDSDLPANTLSYSLVGAPAGAGISSGGLFTWRPPVALANTTNTIQVRVEDNGAPVANDVKSFIVIVNPLASPVVLTPVGFTGGQFSLLVNGTAGPDYVLLASTNLTQWSEVQTNAAPTPPFQFVDPSAGSFPNRIYRVRLQP